MSENTNIQEKKPVKPEITLNGVKYKLRFDLYALEQVEEEFGGMREAFAKLSGGAGMVKAIRTLFKITANSQRSVDGMPESVTGEEIGKHERMSKLTEISEAIRAAIEEGMKAETVDGEADDEVHDGYAEEYNEKVKNG